MKINLTMNNDYHDIVVDKMIPANVLMEFLHYNPETGIFIWRARSRRWFTSDRSYKIWNTRFSKKVAGSVNGRGYILIGINGRLYPSHCLAWFYVYGKWPVEEIDHINHIKTDNRIENLREVSHHENVKNQSLRSDNASGHIGVHWHKFTGKWQTQIQHARKIIYGGVFSNIKDAIAKRKQMETEYGFHENHGI